MAASFACLCLSVLLHAWLVSLLNPPAGPTPGVNHSSKPVSATARANLPSVSRVELHTLLVHYAMTTHTPDQRVGQAVADSGSVSATDLSAHLHMCQHTHTHTTANLDG
ncbi:unnamed protein product [Protopolystoma xenopodis]|uniref:LisH domain-containing protein n=1 Tax=Protopolystoma xenopodis TaxID=117903 RepID=A0A3S5A9U7_9PLAT|nr:unnamed protein product [Protopolystoma xenopodis]